MLTPLPATAERTRLIEDVCAEDIDVIENVWSLFEAIREFGKQRGTTT